VTKPRIVVVVPTIRPESHASFVKAWTPLFEKHSVTLVTVWDGDEPRVEVSGRQMPHTFRWSEQDGDPWETHRDLFCRRTDACRNIGFVAAASMNPTHVLTLDDDVVPVAYDLSKYGGSEREVLTDPIQAHLDALDRRVPLGWMNTAHDTDLYLRGVPYGVRTEAPVMLSHGVWVGTPDFDGETQLRLEKCGACKGEGVLRAGTELFDCPGCRGTGKGQLPHSLPYYVGPMPAGVPWAMCGMCVMVRAEALPYLYFAPQGPDSGFANLHRFADIWMGFQVQKEFARLGWACVSGYATVLHARASDARRNVEQEKLGREWNEFMWVNNDQWEVPRDLPEGMRDYCRSYADKRSRYESLVKSLLEKTT
jgi:hypothetical protein